MNTAPYPIAWNRAHTKSQQQTFENQHAMLCQYDADWVNFLAYLRRVDKECRIRTWAQNVSQALAKSVNGCRPPALLPDMEDQKERIQELAAQMSAREFIEMFTDPELPSGAESSDFMTQRRAYSMEVYAGQSCSSDAPLPNEDELFERYFFLPPQQPLQVKNVDGPEMCCLYPTAKPPVSAFHSTHLLNQGCRKQ
ncbi:hypothetical protein PIIN_06352 [Serendipita indica DSM 11827]|uniref:Uncharacterized protein n=1 Tax=Serendipita indica (strain DSM 11827) TaxID=1109443 RepID=G4TM74_SERID|nr:hypothetical protein PIIN_06352 [Serendipita indica DSM 11827]